MVSRPLIVLAAVAGVALVWYYMTRPRYENFDLGRALVDYVNSTQHAPEDKAEKVGECKRSCDRDCKKSCHPRTTPQTGAWGGGDEINHHILNECMNICEVGVAECKTKCSGCTSCD